jgi:hypothetical protein
MAMQRPRDPGLAAQLFGVTPERTLTLMRAAWPAAVGPEVARRTELVALDGGVLRIRVPDATWRRGLWRMRGDILARLREIAGKAAPRSLGFVEGPVAFVEPAAGTPAPGAAPQAPESLVEAAATIADPELRRRFLAVAARYLGRFGSSAPSADGGGSGAGSGTAEGSGPGTGAGSRDA